MSAVHWGLVVAAGIVAVMLLLQLSVQVAGFWFTLIAGLFAAMGFVAAVVFVVMRRLFGAVVRKLDEIMRVPSEERYDNAVQFEAEVARAPEPDRQDLGGKSEELTAVAERVARIRKAAHGLRDGALGQALEGVGRAAGALLAQAARSRGAFRRLRAPLVHHLGHVEAIALDLLRMQDGGALEPALVTRATATMADVARDFDRLRIEAARPDTVETEARLDLLDQQLAVRRDRPATPRSPGGGRPSVSDIARSAMRRSGAGG